MNYRVEELAAAADVRVDTIRFYQSRGLLPKPRREGRVAIYGSAHLDRLRRIRSLGEQGFSLAQIGRVLQEGEASENPEPLLEALVEKEVGERTYTQSELAQEAGIPEALVQAAVAAGLAQPIEIEGEVRFTGADLEMARAALVILGAGFPLDSLLSVAVSHAKHVEGLADEAIDLFDDYIRKPKTGLTEDESEDPASQEAAAEAFRDLLPQVTRLVALHFQRTLVARAIERLAESDGEGRGDLKRALAVTGAHRLQVEWR